VRAPLLDHLLDERAHLAKCGVRLLRCEMAHDCNPTRRWRIVA
jgi:hypothetical protein